MVFKTCNNLESLREYERELIWGPPPSDQLSETLIFFNASQVIAIHSQVRGSCLQWSNRRKSPTDGNSNQNYVR